MTQIAIKDLRELCIRVLVKAGLKQTDAEITVSHYLTNELSGKTSHGMVRVSEMVKVLQTYGLPQSPITIEKDTGDSIVLNGQKNLGPVIGDQLVAEAIKRCEARTIFFASAYHYIGNTGSMAYYLRKLCDSGLIGVISCNSVPIVAAPHGKNRLVGTNPIGLGVPSDNGKHFIADFATSAIAYGKVIVAMDKGEPIPEGCLIDKEGNPSINPKDAQGQGAILPLADFRGFALSLFVELLAVMVGGDMFKEDWFGKDAMFLIAINPRTLSEGYSRRVSDILDFIRNSTPAPDYNSVTLPGDRSHDKLQTTLQNGTVNIIDKTLQKIRELDA